MDPFGIGLESEPSNIDGGEPLVLRKRVFKLFHIVNGQLQVQVDFKLVSGQFPAAFGTAGGGNINGTLTWYSHPQLPSGTPAVPRAGVPRLRSPAECP